MNTKFFNGSSIVFNDFLLEFRTVIFPLCSCFIVRTLLGLRQGGIVVTDTPPLSLS